MRLHNKVTFIAGASGGIGSSLVQRFLQEGSKVILADRNPSACQELLKKFGKDDQGIVIEMDVTNESQINSAFDASIKKFGKIDVVIYNAGINELKSIIDLSYAEWSKILKVNLDGGFLTSKKAMCEMKKTGGGSIIFMGSIRSKIGGENDAPYVASKHAILGLARVIATEGAKHNIRSNVICPDYIRTPLVEKQIEQLAQEHHMSKENVIKKVMLPSTVDGEFTTVEDISEVAVFCAAFPSNALTGQSILVTHGWEMG
ncbi:MAG: 3-hydroxybutyrate dehydrogenase [Simkania sp.]|nr:3-hydroxybutyrate dehydrogenase [Simkania sp.]